MSKKNTSNAISGVPLGGFGTGYIRLGADGIYRNITINNNRSKKTRLPIAGNTFMAVRCSSQELDISRILRPEHPDLPKTTPNAPESIDRDSLSWRGAYPRSSFSYKDPSFPVEVIWSNCSPIIPFDEEASSMPGILQGIRIYNKTDVKQRVSVLLNWDNLSGITATDFPGFAPVNGALVEMSKTNVPIPEDNYNPEEHVEPDPGELDRFNALLFGPHNDRTDDAIGQHCLAIRSQKGVRISTAPWDYNDPEQEEQFWTAFNEKGNLNELAQTVRIPAAGAVCATMVMEPGEHRNLRAVFSWYTPRITNGTKMTGPQYTNRFDNAVEVASAGLDNFEYYFSSVESWHKRIRSSSLPAWFNTMLINSCSVLTLNGVYLKDGRGGLSNSTEGLEFGPLPHRLYHSLGLLALLSRHEESVIQQLYRSIEEHPKHHTAAFAGALYSDSPIYPNFPNPRVDYWSTLVLSIYRNYLHTGKLARLREALPPLKKYLSRILAEDKDRDGLPEGAYPRATYDGITIVGVDSPTSSLWIAGLTAYLKISKFRNNEEETEKTQTVLDYARHSFERYFWDEHAGYYRLLYDPALKNQNENPASAACHTAQLLGQWYADLLGFGSLFDRNRILRALATIQRYNERMYGVLSAVMPDGSRVKNTDARKGRNLGHHCWPTFSNAHFACLLITRGKVVQGLKQVEKYYRNLQYKQGLLNAAPYIWDVEKNCPASKNLESHVSALSVWHIFYSLIGLQVNIPSGTLRIMPNLPKGIHTLNVPLFIPASLGWIKCQEDNQNGYRQRVHLKFDTPLDIRILELRVPKEVESVKVQCGDTDGPIPTKHELFPLGEAQLLRIHLQQSVVACEQLSFKISRVVLSSSD